MNIYDIIEEKYEYFKSLLPSTNEHIYNGFTYEDILNNVMITAINKFKNTELNYNEGFDYIRKTLLSEILFSKKRKVKDKLIFTPNIILYDKSEE